jgi:hypothetical protein
LGVAMIASNGDSADLIMDYDFGTSE